MNRTPEQLAAIETVGENLCVAAGAGSGKTSVLIGRVLHILERRLARLDEIVAITFTDKAAAEMRERLRHEFHQRAPADDPEAMNFWRDLERRAETARFSTIHSFCASLLRENALALQTDPDFAVLAEAEAFLLRGEAIESALHGMLNARDEAAIRVASEYGVRRLRVMLRRMIKSRAVMERIAREHPLHDPEALAQHWRELVLLEGKRRRAALGRSRELRSFRRRLAAFDGKCADPAEGRETLRREMIAVLDHILSGTDAEAIERGLKVLAETKTRGSKKPWNSDADYDALKEVQDAVRKFAKDQLHAEPDETVERAAAQLTCDLHAVYLRVAAAYQEAKAARIAHDFDDLILAALTMLRGNAHVRARTARGIKFLLIDEFQDTDDRQLEIARRLSREPGGPELFIVGDAKQSIYGFRGAEVDVFLQARAEADQTIPLDINFRAVPEVLDFANDFFAQSGLLEAVEDPYHPLRANRAPVEEHHVEFLLPEMRDGASADEYRREEARLIAERLARRCTGADRVHVGDPATGESRPANFGDVALLFRSMTSIHIYEQALRESGIPYLVVSGAGFYERQEVRDVRNLLTAVIDPWDEMALLAFLRGPMAGLPDDALIPLCADRGLAANFYSGEMPEGFQHAATLLRARGLLRDLRAHAELPLPEFLHHVFDRTRCEALALSQFLGLRKALNVRKIAALAEDFAHTRAPKLGAFVRYLDEVAEEADIREGEAAAPPDSAGAVTLMTIHKAKGLEFPMVVIPDIGRGVRGRDTLFHRRLGLAASTTDPDGETAHPALYAHMRADDLDADMAEQARILYVAMTRARDWLVLGGAPERRHEKTSWLEPLDEVFHLRARADGEELSGNGWRAVMWRNPCGARVSGAETTDEEPPAREVLEKRIAKVPPRNPNRVTFSISELLDAMCGGHDDRESDETERMNYELGIRNPEGKPASAVSSFILHPSSFLLRGTLVHRMFERWDFANPADPPIEHIVARECPAVNLRAGLETLLRDAADQFRRSALWERVTRDTALQREAPFMLRVEDALAGGTIDLLLSDGTIIDYKTGTRDAALERRYKRQLQLYAAAVGRLLGKAVPAACLYYTASGEVIPVDCSPPKQAEALEHACQTIQSLRAKAE